MSKLARNLNLNSKKSSYHTLSKLAYDTLILLLLTSFQLFIILYSMYVTKKYLDMCVMEKVSICEQKHQQKYAAQIHEKKLIFFFCVRMNNFKKYAWNNSRHG